MIRYAACTAVNCLYSIRGINELEYRISERRKLPKFERALQHH